MIFKIKTPAQAETILRSLADCEGVAIFDIHPGVNAAEIPFIIRQCKGRGHDHEYVGPNIWGRNFEKRSTYCPQCGYAMRTVAQAALAIQGAVVLETGYRSEGTARSVRVPDERDELREALAAMTSALGKAETERDAMAAELTEIRKGFTGHVYVTNDEYSKLVAELDEARHDLFPCGGKDGEPLAALGIAEGHIRNLTAKIEAAQVEIVLRVDDRLTVWKLTAGSKDERKAIAADIRLMFKAKGWPDA